VAGESPEALIEAIKRVRKALPVKQPVVVGLPTRLAVVATVEPLVVHAKRASLAVQFELQEHLPYEAAQAVWQYQWFNGHGDAAAPKHAVVAALKRSLLEERVALCQRAGLAVREVGVSCLAAVNAWIQQLGSPDTCQGILLHVEEQNLEWIVVDRDGLRVFPLPVTTSPEDALNASWDSLREMVGMAAPASSPTVWVLGESASVSRVAEVLKGDLGCQVEKVSLSAEGSAEAGEPFAVACGLALQGVGAARLPMNLLAEIARRRTLQRTRRVTALASWCLALTAAALAGSGMWSILQAKQRLLERVKAQERLYQDLRPEIRAMLQVHEQYEQRLQQLEYLLSTRPLVIRAFQQLVDVLPDDAWLIKAELAKGPNLDGTAEGYATSFQVVTRLMDQLKASAGWATVKLLGTNVTVDPASGKELVVFTVQMQRPLAKQEPAPVEEPAAPAKAAKPKGPHPPRPPTKTKRAQ